VVGLAAGEYLEVQERMKIISPVDNLAEADLLLDAGAHELYGGWVPAEWEEKYTLLASINQRTFAGAQLSSREELAGVVAKVHGRGGAFSLTLNSPYYTDEQLPLLLDYVDQAVEAGVDGLILADIGLLRCLRQRHPGLEYHASTLAHLMNSEAMRIYLKEGISRIIFPRHLTVAEMAEVASRLPGVSLDAFMLVGKCPNTEGLCTFHHSSPDRIWPCEIPYEIRPEREPASPALRAAMARQESWSRTDRRHGCGLCAIPHLRDAGIHGLKLVGRGAPPAMKVKNILLVRDFLRLSEQEADFTEYRRKAREAHRVRFGTPCSPNVCYYPEYYQSE
jgi:putative protease